MKTLKKNTWRRNFKAWVIRLDRKQQLRTTVPAVDDTDRVCVNCGEEYTGRFCPQCGQSGIWDRFSMKQALLNFVDIWGLGNRPMFRTIRELFWRPGYMVRDYLKGHRQFYFPPFKLLSLAVVFMMAIYYITGLKYQPEAITPIDENTLNQLALAPVVMTLLQWAIKLNNFISGNPLYEQFVITALNACVIKIAFNKIGGYNGIETFIFLIYLAAQSILIKIPGIFFSGLYELSDKYLLASIKLSSPTVYASLLAVGAGFKSLVSGICVIISVLMTLLAFRQFYGLSWKSTITRIILSTFVPIILFVIAAIFGAAFKYIGFNAIWVLLVFLLVFIAPLYFYKKNHSTWALMPLIILFGIFILLLFIIAFAL